MRRRRRTGHDHRTASGDVRPGPAEATGSCPPATGRAAFAFRGSATSTSPSTSPSLPATTDDLFVVEQTGRVEVGARRRAASAAVPRHQRPGHVLGRRAGPAVDRLRARLPERPAASTSTTPTPAGDTRVVEYRRSRPTRWRRRPASARELVLHVDQPFTNHNGGLLLFGPDGLLYIGIGDGGSRGRPRTRTARTSPRLLGKILRIDPRPSGGTPVHGPRSQPVRRPSGRPAGDLLLRAAQPVALLLRPATGALAIGDVGQNEFEEVDLVARGEGLGANFGWSAFEGFDRFNDDQQAPDAVAAGLRLQPRRGLLDHRRLRRPRPQPSLALRPLPLRRLLRRSAAQLHGHARPARHRRPRARARGPVAELVRRGRRRPHLCDLAARTRLPARAGRLSSGWPLGRSLRLLRARPGA